MITAIELALVDRLTRGLGQMVREVATYSRELDGDIGDIVRCLPAVWVTFGGVTNTRRYSTSGKKRIVTGRFAIMVCEYNTRSDESARHGGVTQDEVGTNLLVDSVRRLITGQDLGLKIDYFVPGQVRTLFNTETHDEAISVCACEFDTRWTEVALENGKWPERSTDPAHPDAAFNAYGGELSDPDPELLRIGIRYHQPGTNPVNDPKDLVELRNTQNGED